MAYGTHAQKALCDYPCDFEAIEVLLPHYSQNSLQSALDVLRSNTPELVGNAVAAGISNLYHPAQDRSFGNIANKSDSRFSQLGVNLLQAEGIATAYLAALQHRGIDPNVSSVVLAGCHCPSGDRLETA